MDTVVLFERSASNAASLVGQVPAQQRHAPTPCAAWDVEALLAHMVGGTGYLLGALGLAGEPVGTDEESYRAAVARCVEAARVPGALERRCMSPAGFEWSIREAAAGTAMDQLVHTWDLAVAIGADRRLDPELVSACVDMFVPQMPDIGRQAGIVGPEIPVAADASPQDRLLGAMGRNPEA
ncbi:MAG: TIGR03086 family metal-binding protein [Acidimicrobiia bacterium]